MSKSSLYTRSGDSGLTSLVGGQRVPKYSLRLDAYGTIDEFSSFLGFVAAADKCPDEISKQLEQIQNMLFNLGAYLATQPKDKSENVVGLDVTHIAIIEDWIDQLDDKLPPLKEFILPGGCDEAARAGMARTVCRRAERRILELASKEFVNPLVCAYMNRLSDYLFVLGRYFNHINGIPEVTWKK